MNVLLIGGGGREHALAWKLAQSPGLDRLYAAPGNPGIARHAVLAELDIADHVAVARFCHARDIGLVVIGPERLPKVARQAGQWVSKMRRYVDDVKSDFNRQLELSELRDLKKDVEEAARSIEGSVGGAVRMNAGGHGRETADVLVEAEVLAIAAGTRPEARSVETLGLGYRTSNLRPREIVVGAEFALEPASVADCSTVRSRAGSFQYVRAAACTSTSSTSSAPRSSARLRASVVTA